jgi:hypothetical protein
MATFPKLKTGAVAQYPLARRAGFQNQIVRFVDGSDQRYRDSSGARLEWDIQLSKLDDAELAAVEEFFRVNQGAFGRFAFVDPWDGQTHEDCSIVSDVLELTMLAQSGGKTSFTVVRNQ